MIDYIDGADKRYSLHTEHHIMRLKGAPAKLELCPRCMVGLMFRLPGQITMLEPRCIKCGFMGRDDQPILYRRWDTLKDDGR